MPLIQDYPILDGVAPSWADIKVILKKTGAPLIDMIDIQSLDTTSAVELGVKYGASGGRPMNRTAGQLTEGASMTLYEDGYEKMIAILSTMAPRRGLQAAISLVTFDIVRLYTPLGSIKIYERHIRGCRIIGRDDSATEGTDAAVKTVPLSVMQIVDVVAGQEIVLL